MSRKNNLRGQVTRTWGDTPYPLEYVYDSTYARMTQLKTFRGGAGWSGPDWPAEPGTPDTTTWTHQESTGLLTSKTYADSHGTTYTYDTAGRLATRTWSRLVVPPLGGPEVPLVTTYTYSPTTGEMTSVDYSDATPDVTFTYTRLGQQATVTDATGSRTFAYTTTLELDTEALDETFYSSKILTRKYQTTGTGEVPGRDAGFQIGTDEDPDADYDVAYSYSTVGRFSGLAVAAPVSGAFSYSYLTNSDLLATTTYPSDITVTRAYESNRNLIDYIENKVDTTTVSKYDYTNDAVGRRTQSGWSGTAFTQGDTIAYGYNTRSEVTSAVATNRGTYDFAYAYDPIGNRQSYAIDQGTPTAYTANQLNQYTAISSLTNPAYDLDGNMTLMPSAAGDWALTWDAENRLIEAVKTNATRLVFTYDYMSRRVEKKAYAWVDDAWELSGDQRFLYDGWNLILRLDAGDDNATLQAFTWGLDLSQSLQGAGGGGGMLAVYDAGDDETYFPLFDANGNVSEYLDSTGAAAAHYEYDPFGGTTVASGDHAADFAHRFSTKFLDAENGLYYYGYRYLSTELGRWVSRDPIEDLGASIVLDICAGQEGICESVQEGESGSGNPYDCLGNAPLDLVDILGLRPACCKCNETQKMNLLKYGACMFMCELTGEAVVGGVAILALYDKATAKCAKGPTGKSCRQARRAAQKALKYMAKKLGLKAGKKGVSKFIPGVGWIMIFFDTAKCLTECYQNCDVYDCVKSSAPGQPGISPKANPSLTEVPAR